MSVESDADRLEFLDVDEFGISLSLVLGSPVTEISGIFDDAHFEIDNGISVISSSEPMAHVRTSDVTGSPSVLQGTTVIIAGDSYSVTDIEPDGTGMTLLKMHKL